MNFPGLSINYIPGKIPTLDIFDDDNNQVVQGKLLKEMTVPELEALLAEHGIVREGADVA